MVRGANKSGSRKKVFVRTPSGVKTKYVEKRPSKPVCAITGKPLAGVPRGPKNSVRKLAKTKRRPSRPFGGVLSSPAMRQLLRAQARLFSASGDKAE